MGTVLDEDMKVRVGHSSGSAISLNNSYLCTLLEICTSSKREMTEALAWLMTNATSHTQSRTKLFLDPPRASIGLLDSTKSDFTFRNMTCDV